MKNGLTGFVRYLSSFMTGSLKKEDETKRRSLGAADYCIKPATVEEMETTLMCLRGHLGPSWTKRNNDGPGSSASMSWDYLVSVYYGLLPPLCDPRSSWTILTRTGTGGTWPCTRCSRSWYLNGSERTSNIGQVSVLIRGAHYFYMNL